MNESISHHHRQSRGKDPMTENTKNSKDLIDQHDYFFRKIGGGRETLAVVDQNCKDVNKIPKAPKKAKTVMKSSKRKKIFGSLYKRRKQATKMTSDSENDYYDNKETKETRIKRTFSGITRTRKKKKMDSQSKGHDVDRNKNTEALPAVEIGMKNITCYDEMKSIAQKQKLLSQNDFTGLQNMYARNPYILKQDTPTEVSALTMSSPQTVLKKFHARERQKIFSVPQQEIIETKIQKTKSQSDSYTQPGCIIFNKSSSSAYTNNFNYSSESSSSSCSEDECGGFTLKVEPIMVTTSSLTSHSTDCSGESSEGSCSVSTSASHLYEHCREKSKLHSKEGADVTNESKPESSQVEIEIPKYKRVLSAVKDTFTSYSCDVKSALSTCFAPPIESPEKKILKGCEISNRSSRY